MWTCEEVGGGVLGSLGPALASGTQNPWTIGRDPQALWGPQHTGPEGSLLPANPPGNSEEGGPQKSEINTGWRETPWPGTRRTGLGPRLQGGELWAPGTSTWEPPLGKPNSNTVLQGGVFGPWGLSWPQEGQLAT